MISRTAVGAAAPVILIVVLLGAAAGAASALFGGGGGQPAASADATSDIPPDYLGWYQHAAADACPGLPWTVLASVGKVESDHGRSMLPGVHVGTNLAGAKGPMQFLQTTFDHYATPVPPGGAVPPSPYDPRDAIWAAARMICANGANRGDLRAAVFAYNHSTDYVNQVLGWADRYATTPSPLRPPNGAAGRAIAFATEQLGLPYVWGGNGPAHGDAGFDCSGLTTAAYAAADIDL
ncbi:MAG TPA: NlpC/P60 family protein, partial [Mycobacteriales bacterium]|nr:NlpC/P60 family protein [Mycobacteriales bacterium]